MNITPGSRFSCRSELHCMGPLIPFKQAALMLHMLPDGRPQPTSRGSRGLPNACYMAGGPDKVQYMVATSVAAPRPTKSPRPIAQLKTRVVRHTAHLQIPGKPRGTLTSASHGSRTRTTLHDAPTPPSIPGARRPLPQRVQPRAATASSTPRTHRRHVIPDLDYCLVAALTR